MSLPNISIRYILEPRRGKGYAYNTGIAAARGTILLFTDDDVRVPVDWIRRMSQPLLGGVADAVAGGVVFPPEIAAVLARPPFSLRRPWFASTEDLDRHSTDRMVGANMAFHRRVLDRVPKIDVELGPGGLGFGEETLFSRQLVEAGFKLRGTFDVEVEHCFDHTRLTGVSLLDLARKMGRCHAFVFHHWEHKRSRLAIPRLILSHLRLAWTRGMYRFRGNQANSISDQTVRAEHNLAFYREYLVQRRRPRKYPLHGLAPCETVA